MARRMRTGGPAGSLGAGIAVLSACLGLPPGAPAGEAPDAKALAAEILAAAGVRGGLVVHVGCGDGRLTAALGASRAYLVQGLDADRGRVEEARAHIRSLGLYGRVSVDLWAGDRLPYVDGLVNLLVSERPLEIPKEEVRRVLAPRGVAYVRRGGEWTKTVEPRPEAIDEWTHYLHDASNNAVAHDSIVGPPRHLQWVGSPRWARHHDRMASMSALVSSGGRIFYIIDEGPRASILLPSKWSLVARDAFSGTILWKRSIPSWHTRLWPFKSGPAQLPRRLVAVGDRVYVTLGLRAPLTALDAATGETIRTHAGTKATEEIIASRGVLFLLVDDSSAKPRPYTPIHRNIGQAKARVAREWPWDGKARWIVAIRADTGDILWRKEQRVVPLTLAADPRCVFFHDGERIVCLDRRRGDERWRSAPVARRSPIPTCFGPTLVVYRDVVLFSGGNRSMTALSAETGETLWTEPHPRSGHNSPEDLLVAGGLVWAGATASGRESGVFTGRDLHTGEVRSEFPPDVTTYWFHHRCHRGKATDRYLLPSRTGIEFVDYASKHWIPHHWVRGGCIYGIMPCNGLVYAPPHDCACYIEAKLYGFNALAPESATRRVPRKASEKGRLERGPAYGQPVEPGAGTGPDDWPTYRHDPTRGGSTRTAVPADLRRAWRTRIGGRLSSIVAAGGSVFVASTDAHAVYALDARSGRIRWCFTAGGRVDSPPTIHVGRALFGSLDGWVYCLRASDGALIWRFRAAPMERRLVAFEQVESVWPVHGSVLVRDGVALFVAGRSMFLDGGMRLCRLDVKTGGLLSETILDDRDPETGENLQGKVDRLNMPPALPDILSCDGRYVYMRSQRFDLDGKRLEVITPTDARDQKGEGAHLLAATGFLDGSWFHRSYWIYGKTLLAGAGGWPRAGHFAPAGRILAFDDASVYGFGRKPQYYRWSTPLQYHLFATDKQPRLVPMAPARSAQGSAKRSAAKPAPKRPRARKKAKRPRRDARRRPTAPACRWSRSIPLLVRAMALTGETLWIAGPPAVVDEERAFDRIADPEIRAKLAEQTAALEGRRGASLWAVSARDGEKLAAYELDSPPVWDGMAAAKGRLVLSTRDGEILCFGSAQQ